MQQVKIYIETDSSSPKATEKHYGYVLEVMVSGQAVTREGFGKITGTYHQTVLTALAKALDRFKIYMKATTVHHVNYVKKHPDMALEIWYEWHGVRKRNLVSLCHDCHEAVHGYRKPEKKENLTEERWD